MVSAIWVFLIVSGFVVAALSGRVDIISKVALDTAQNAVAIAIGMVSLLAFWSGIMNLAEKSGLTKVLAFILAPLVRWLFPSIPEGHPAQGAILMNMSANILGLGSAATPLGLVAMEHMQELNEDKETASDAMCTLLAINTSAITLIPTTVIAIRASAGAADPTDVIATTLVATTCSSLVAITLDRTIQFLRGHHR